MERVGLRLRVPWFESAGTQYKRLFKPLVTPGDPGLQGRCSGRVILEARYLVR
jgi:hypothetical protein